MTSEQIKFRLFAFPRQLKAPNAYWDNLYDGIAKSGKIEIYHNEFWRLLFSFHRPQVVHLHWPTILYASRYPLLRPIKLLIRFKILLLAKLRGDKLVWTMHNVQSHEDSGLLLDKLATRFLVKFSDSIIVHTEAGKAILQQRFDRTRGVYVIEHGNYVNFHGPVRNQPDAMLQQRLGLKTTDQVFLSLGSIKKYKGIENIIKFFNQQPDEIKLLIAGKSFDQKYLAYIKSLAGKKNVIFDVGTIPGEQLPEYFSIARASLFAFKTVLTSGSVILSLSYGVPVLVPESGDFPYLIKNGFNGFRYNNEQEFGNYLQLFIKMSHNDLNLLKRNSFGFASGISYNEIINKTLKAYKITN